MIVDDHSIMRIGLQQVLEQSGEFEVVGQAADGNEHGGVRFVRTHTLFPCRPVTWNQADHAVVVSLPTQRPPAFIYASHIGGLNDREAIDFDKRSVIINQ